MHLLELELLEFVDAFEVLSVEFVLGLDSLLDAIDRLQTELLDDISFVGRLLSRCQECLLVSR